jgi:hypothetical protein
MRPRQTYFDDILWATNKGKVQITRNEKEVVNVLVNSPKIHKAMLDYILTNAFQTENPKISEEEALVITENLVKDYASEL